MSCSVHTPQREFARPKKRQGLFFLDDEAAELPRRRLAELGAKRFVKKKGEKTCVRVRCRAKSICAREQLPILPRFHMLRF